MRKRIPAAVLALAVLIGLLTATPALATFSVVSILFPNGATTFYSPFDGPASITLDFNDHTEAGTDDPITTLQFRLRVQGGATLHTQDVTINPGTQTSPRTEQFSWPALNVNSQTRYEVAVYRGTTQLRSRAFTMKPWLVKITSITADPFFPTLQNGHMDTTTITYNLAANSNPLDLRIFNASNALVRQQHFDNRVAGTYSFTWNGRNTAGVTQPEGVYRVEVTATDFAGIDGASQATVTLARFYRVTASAVKNGIAYHHRDPVVVLRSGGTCAVADLTDPKDVRIRCTDARVRVWWRWTLPTNDPRIESVAFDLVPVTGFTCGATKGSSGRESFIQVGALGQRRCQVDKARISYSYLEES
jgi:FlgD Ig-like domain